MLTFIFSVIFWTLALYGFIEIIKNIYYIVTYTNLRANGIYVIIAVKNQEEKIEGFLRTVLFRMLYGKEEMIKQMIVADLGSTDETAKIVEKIAHDNHEIKAVNWKECKEIIDAIDKTS